MLYPHRFRQNLSFDIDKSEYLCPLCEALCNTALPLLPSVTTTAVNLRSQDPPSATPTISLTDWIKGLQTILKHKVCDYSRTRNASRDTSLFISLAVSVYPVLLLFLSFFFLFFFSRSVHFQYYHSSLYHSVVLGREERSVGCRF